MNVSVFALNNKSIHMKNNGIQKKMKVVHTVENFPSNGGIDNYLNLLLPELVKYRVEIEILSKGENSSKTVNGITVITRNNDIDIISYLNKKKPDIIHIHEWPSLSTLRKKYFRNFNPKLITHHHGYSFICPGTELFFRKQKTSCSTEFGLSCIFRAYINHCQLSRKIKSIIDAYCRVMKNKNLLNEIDLSIADSTFVLDKLINFGLSNSKTTYLNYFTDIKIDKISEPYIGQLLYIGRFIENKGIEILFDAVAILPDSCKWSIKLMGEGYYKKYLIDYAKSLNIYDKIEFIPWQRNKNKINVIKESDILIVPSIWDEAFGIVGIEAMACAKPVVAFNVGGISDWLTDSYNGFLIPKFDVDLMAKKIYLLITNRNLNSKLGKNGLKEVDSKFRAKKHVKSLIQFYYNLTHV